MIWKDRKNFGFCGNLRKKGGAFCAMRKEPYLHVFLTPVAISSHLDFVPLMKDESYFHDKIWFQGVAPFWYPKSKRDYKGNKITIH